MGLSVDSSLDHIVLINNAKRALERGRFELTYQPIYSVDHREVDSVETLLRWRLSPGRLAVAKLSSVGSTLCGSCSQPCG